MIPLSSMEKSEEVVLNPMHRLPVLIALLGIPILIIPVPNFVGITISTFGLFLLVILQVFF